ncbi:MAG: hypothetical protein SOZ84_03040 [Treponema sp.]|nr:hypothetical protein [Treponema sp.]
MKKRILFPAVFIGLVTALFILGCNNVFVERIKVPASAPSYDPAVGLSWDSSTTTLTIYNETGLINFRKIVNGDVSSSAPITVGDKTFSGQDRSVNATLANDIDLTSSEDWTPIGKSGSSSGYAGTFDGAGYTVFGVKISSGGSKGFFGQIESQAIITGLTVAGNISVSSSTGGIVGTAVGGTIEYCVNKINVTSSGKYVGGIVGTSRGTTTITGCVNLADITGDNYIGGIIGQASSTYTAIIDRCINMGSITSSNSNYPRTGGIQGFSDNTANKITNSLNLGSIKNHFSGRGAGIVYNGASNTIQYCLSAGPIGAWTRYAIASNPSGNYTRNYYDSEKIYNPSELVGASIPGTGGTGKATSALKVASAWDSSWSTTNWSFASGRYPLPNIQDNIPPEIWTEIENLAK